MRRLPARRAGVDFAAANDGDRLRKESYHTGMAPAKSVTEANVAVRPGG